MSINRTLSDEILNEIENLSREEIGSDKYKANVDAIAKLLDRKIELEKLEFEKIDKEKSREADINIKLSQIEDNKKERCLNISLFLYFSSSYQVVLYNIESRFNAIYFKLRF